VYNLGNIGEGPEGGSGTEAHQTLHFVERAGDPYFEQVLVVSLPLLPFRPPVKEAGKRFLEGSA
jgi:hypothetical protein